MTLWNVPENNGGDKHYISALHLSFTSRNPSSPPHSLYLSRSLSLSDSLCASQLGLQRATAVCTSGSRLAQRHLQVTADRGCRWLRVSSVNSVEFSRRSGARLQRVDQSFFQVCQLCCGGAVVLLTVQTGGLWEGMRWAQALRAGC